MNETFKYLELLEKRVKILESINSRFLRMQEMDHKLISDMHQILQDVDDYNKKENKNLRDRVDSVVKDWDTGE